MIVYFDTSAFVPLLVIEPGTSLARELWDSADEVVTTRLLYVEAAERVDAPDLVVASGDKDVLTACAELSLATALTGQ